MLKRRIKTQAKIIEKLHDENNRLRNENEALKTKIQEQIILIEAAMRYRDEHQRVMRSLNGAREKYGEAIRKIRDEKKWHKMG